MIIKLQNGDKIPIKLESNEKKSTRKRFKEYAQLSPWQTIKRNFNIASSFLKEGPNITNFGNAVSALFGGFSPENPDVTTGEPPAVGIKNFENLVKTARVAREFNDVLSKAPKTKEFIMPGLIGWAPKTKFKGYHASNENPFIPDFFREGWAQKIHNALKGIYIANGKVPGYGFLTKRKYVHPVETTFEKPQIQLGEVKGRTKNGVRNQIERDAQEQGADGIIFKGVADNQMQNQFIAKTLNPDTKIINGPVNLFQKPNENNDSRQNVYVAGDRGWKELSYPYYINYVWNNLKNKGIKTEPYDRNNINNQTRMNFLNKSFIPVFKIYPEQGLKAHAQEILRRMKNFGLDVDNTMGELPLYGKKSIKDLVTLNSGRTSYVGYYNEPGIVGTFFHNNGTSIVDPGYPAYKDFGLMSFLSNRAQANNPDPYAFQPLQSIISTMHHERNMHGTQKFLTPEMWKLYEDFLSKMTKNLRTDKDAIGNLKVYVKHADGMETPIDTGSLLKEELRATIGEMVKNLYETKAYSKLNNANVSKYDLETLKPYFEQVVDDMSDYDLYELLKTINGYGEDYAKIGPKENPNFYKELRNLLKVAPAALPFLIPRKEEKK